MFDTSGLVKYYATEIGSHKVQKIIDEARNRIFISDLSIVELISTLAKKVRIGEITIATFRIARRRFFADITIGKYSVVMLTQKHGRFALKLLVKHATKHGLRTLDSLQFAIAMDLKDKKSMDCFVCADDKLDKITKLEKVTFLNPEKP
jgi:predicted nucleic acid-binding protein